jgi:isopenicillin N synthase-like dioxygenase
MDLVPTIDISDPTETSLGDLDRACADHGFFLLRGHGLDELIARTWSEAERLFATGPEVKDPLRRTEDRQLGYHDRELTKRLRDHKEVFDFLDPSLPGADDLNRWPEGLDGFRPTMAEYFDAFAGLTATTLDLIHATLGLGPDVAAAHGFARHASSVRLNHYPVGDPVPAGERDGLRPLGEVALGHHTDPGVITLLLQDDAGGLQVDSREHGWIDVPPRPGTVVVNLADAMQVWTNDRYRAAVHRVQPMTDRTRYSIPFFANPSGDQVIEPISALVDGAPRYRSFEWGEFMQGRIDDNYEDTGAEDIQIDHYAIV